MTTRSVGASAGFGWLTRGFSMAFRHPKPLLGGATILFVAMLLPSLVTLPMRLHEFTGGAAATPTMPIASMAISLLLSLFLMPLYGGYLRLIDEAENSRPARARDIFAPYRDGSALRLIGFLLAMMLVYVAAFGTILVTVGSNLIPWWMEAISAQAQHLPAPPLPSSFGITFALFLVIALFMSGVHAIGLGQVAIGRRGILGAIGDGFVGTAKNLPSFLAFMLVAVLAWIGFFVALILLVMVAVLLAKLVGAWLLYALFIPFYFALIVIMSIGMFGVMYQVWRDVCGTDDSTAAPEPLAA